MFFPKFQRQTTYFRKPSLNLSILVILSFLMAHFKAKYHTLVIRTITNEVTKIKKQPESTKVESFENVASKLPYFRVFFGFQSSFEVFSLFFGPCIIYHWKAQVLSSNIHVLQNIFGIPVRVQNFVDTVAKKCVLYIRPCHIISPYQ